jgi:hypothetical protein
LRLYHTAALPCVLQDFVLDYALDLANHDSPRALMWATVPHPHELRHLLNFPPSYLPLLQHPQLVRTGRCTSNQMYSQSKKHMVLACGLFSALQGHWQGLTLQCVCHKRAYHHAAAAAIESSHQNIPSCHACCSGVSSSKLAALLLLAGGLGWPRPAPRPEHVLQDARRHAGCCWHLV